MTKIELSETMALCLAEVGKRGALVRFDGGFWAPPGTPLRDRRGVAHPDYDWFTARTISSLVGRHELVVTEVCKLTGSPLRVVLPEAGRFTEHCGVKLPEGLSPAVFDRLCMAFDLFRDTPHATSDRYAISAYNIFIGREPGALELSPARVFYRGVELPAGMTADCYDALSDLFNRCRDDFIPYGDDRDLGPRDYAIRAFEAVMGHLGDRGVRMELDRLRWERDSARRELRKLRAGVSS